MVHYWFKCDGNIQNVFAFICAVEWNRIMQEKSEVEFIEYEPQHKLTTIPDSAETDALEIDELKKAMKEFPKRNNSYNFSF